MRSPPAGASTPPCPVPASVPGRNPDYSCALHHGCRSAQGCMWRSSRGRCRHVGVGGGTSATIDAEGCGAVATICLRHMCWTLSLNVRASTMGAAMRTAWLLPLTSRQARAVELSADSSAGTDAGSSRTGRASVSASCTCCSCRAKRRRCTSARISAAETALLDEQEDRLHWLYRSANQAVMSPD